MPTVVIVPVHREKGELDSVRKKSFTSNSLGLQNSIVAYTKYKDSLHRKLGDLPFFKTTSVDENPAIFDIRLIAS